MTAEEIAEKFIRVTGNNQKWLDYKATPGYKRSLEAIEFALRHSAEVKIVEDKSCDKCAGTGIIDKGRFGKVPCWKCER